MENQFGTCPWNGNPCCGVDACAPAKFVTAHHSETLQELGERPQVRMCPISDIVISARIVAMGVLPLLLGPQEEPKQGALDQALEQLPIDQ